MNKAFTREPDDPDDLRCPRCGSIGLSVGLETLQAHLPPGEGEGLASSVCFCGNPGCEVGYFDGFGQMVEAKALRGRVYPKDPTAPICCCLGLSAEDIIADARRKDPRRVRQIIARSQTPGGHCATASPAGQCCVGEVQRLYLKHQRAR